ncbi:MAG TPA: DUF1295 domain-containing protein [Dermatophilaceae bacterium]|nr:DUF1295 domain-containing protein [Dermatophilaceae bacterium]
MSFDWSAFLWSLPVTLAATALLMGLTFGWARAAGRHSVVDTVWGLGFVLVAAVAYAVSGAGADRARATVVVLLTALWGVRLATHVALRARGHGEDRRYAELLDQAGGDRTGTALRRIYLPQGAVMWFVSLPVQVAMFQPDGLSWLAFVGVAVWAVGVFFEAVGDWQLGRFTADPASQGTVLDTGLWRYTRHPNYFGDACVWWGLWIVAGSAWPGVLTVLSPVLMTWLLAKGTGKPLLEKDIGSRRPGYQDYVERTSGFLPRPPKR